MNSYQEAHDYLYRFTNFEARPQDSYMAKKLDATRPSRLMAVLNNPHQTYPAIHIAGTKGKGSVAAICAAGLRAAGLRVGLYTSPHLIEFRERIRMLTPDDPDGRIPQQTFADLVENEIKTAVGQIPDVTWYELVTAIAFLHFARQKVDIAVIEVGLGGRLDSTNVVTPLVSVISSLSLDHTEFLGDTIAAIAAEKGGIIKPNVPVVSAAQPPEAMARLQAIAHENNAPLSVIETNWQYEKEIRRLEIERLDAKERQSPNLPISQSPPPNLLITAAPQNAFIPAPSSFTMGLRGSHQLANATLALAALNAVAPQFPSLTPEAAREGLATVEWHGRLQILHCSPLLLLDGAHNADSAGVLRQALEGEFDYGRLHFIFAVSGGHNAGAMMQQLFPLAATIAVTQSGHPRALPPDKLARQAADAGFAVAPYPTLEEALTAVWQTAAPNDLICVAGSLFIVGDLLNQWESLKFIIEN